MKCFLNEIKTKKRGIRHDCINSAGKKNNRGGNRVQWLNGIIFFFNLFFFFVFYLVHFILFFFGTTINKDGEKTKIILAFYHVTGLLFYIIGKIFLV